MFKRYLSVMYVAALFIAGDVSALAQFNNYDTQKVINAMRVRHDDLVMLAAHRGIHSLLNNPSYTEVPENSLQAINIAAHEGIEIVELDVRLTQDGVPILTHDSTWGRETNVGANWKACCFDPWGPFPGLTVPDGDPGELGGGADSPSDPQKAINPNVSDWSLYSVQQSQGGIKQRTSNNRWTVSGSNPPTLQNALDFIRSNQLNIVVALDIKDGNAMQAAWRVVASNNDYKGTPYVESVFFKFDAAWVYPYFDNFKNAFNSHYAGNGTYSNPDWIVMNIMPVFQTSAISPRLYGSEDQVLSAIRTYEGQAAVLGVEVNLKQSPGILSRIPAWKVGSTSTALANFNPYAEWIDANDPYQTYRFFYSNGYCCSVPRDWFYFGGLSGQPSDTNDLRLDWNFLLDQGIGFNLITTDNVLPMAQYLYQEGRRNTSYYQ
jgi:glycerophosphoryl diester phosphodiesterase